jgi:hypothetical protein
MYPVYILQGIAKYSTLKFLQEDLPYLVDNIPIQTISALSFPKLSGGQWMAMKHLMNR